MERLDLTEGSPTKQILKFALPIIGGSLFQQLYNFVDTLIVGRLIGVDAVAAIGAFYPLSFLVLGFIQGTCIGFTIPLSHSIGQKNSIQTYKFVTNGIWLSAILAAIVTPAMIFIAPNLLRLLNTPTGILHSAIVFTLISFIGIPANILFNFTADVLRAFGDARHPLYFLVVSLLVNVGLDLYFILSLHLGISGAALATVISEFVGGFLNAIILFTGRKRIRIPKNQWRLFPANIRQMCAVGFPMGLEYAVSSIGAILMQDAINLLGTNAVAAQSAGDKIRQLFTLPMESVGAAMATYQAQNFGAQKMVRIKRGIQSGVGIQIVYSVLSFCILNIFKHSLVVAVLGTGSSRVTVLADKYLFLISFFFPIHGLLMIFRNTLQGWGKSWIAILSGVGELIGRTIGGAIALTTIGFTAICFANSLAWTLSLIYCLFMTKRFFAKGNGLFE